MSSKTKSRKSKVVGYISGSKYDQKKQKANIKLHCKANKIVLHKFYAESIFDLMLNLRKGDTIIVSELPIFSKDEKDLTNIIFACQKNDVGIIPIRESYFLDLSPKEYLNLRPDTEEMSFRLSKYIAQTVLWGTLPPKQEIVSVS